MFKLLRAEFSRMFGSVSFISGTALCLSAGGIFVFINTSGGSGDIFIEENLFLLYGLVTVVSAVFTSLFLGSEYSCGAIRNKLIIGHKRLCVYLADFITVVTGAVIFNAATMLPWVFAWDRARLGCTEKELASRILTSFCAVAACCSLFALLSLIITRPRISAAAALIAAILLLSAPANNFSGLSPKEKIAMNVIPSCHLKKLALANSRYDKDLNAAALPLYSLGVTAMSAAVGAVIFDRKNLR